MRLPFSFLSLFVFSIFVNLATFAQPKNDTIKTPPASTRPQTGPKPYKDVITAKAISDEGMFTVHKVEDKYFFEIPDSLMGREILIVNRISKSAAGLRSGGG